MYGSRNFNSTGFQRFNKREELYGEKFYDRFTQINREDDVLDRMEQRFNDEVGMKFCPLGTFINIFDRSVSYHGLILPEDIINEFKTEDPKYIDWKGFIEKCRLDLRISYDLDEALGKFK